MRKYNVLFVPAGSGMAVAAMCALKDDPDIRVVSADSSRLSPGIYVSRKSYIVPRFDNPRFYGSIKSIVDREKIDIIIPALDTILLEFSKRRHDFGSAKVMVSKTETIEVTRDKWKTYEALKSVVDIPKSFIRPEDVDVPFPLIIKPRDGSGSKDVFRLENREEMDFFFGRVPNPIMQEYLPGKEYTVDCLADGKGGLIYCIPRIRIEAKAGISVKSMTVRNERLESMAKKISDALSFDGPFFFQAKEDVDGTPKLTEINPRISGTMSLSARSCGNGYSLAIRNAMGEKVGRPEVEYGLYVVRHWQDIYLSEEDMKKIPEGCHGE